MYRQQIGFKLVKKIGGGSLFIELKAAASVSGFVLPPAPSQ